MICKMSGMFFYMIKLVLRFHNQNVSLIELFLFTQDTFWWFFLEKFQVRIYSICMVVKLYM